MAYQHPQIPTLENIEIMCQSAPILCQNIENLQKEFFLKTRRPGESVTCSKKNKKEEIVQKMLTSLNEFKAFQVLDRPLIQPGTSVKVPDVQALNFLKRTEISREIGTAIVDQQILKNRLQ